MLRAVRQVSADALEPAAARPPQRIPITPQPTQKEARRRHSAGKDPAFPTCSLPTHRLDRHSLPPDRKVKGVGKARSVGYADATATLLDVVALREIVPSAQNLDVRRVF